MKQSRKKVLVVDDDEMHLYTTKGLLQNERIEVITHQHGFGVTNLVRDARPDLILLDMNMPALSGDRLTSLLKSNGATSGVPIVFYSSNDEDTLRQSVEKYRVQGYICKGNIADLRNKVDRYLGMAPEEAATA